MENSFQYVDPLGLLKLSAFSPGIELYSNDDDFRFMFLGVGFEIDEAEISKFNNNTGNLISYNKISIIMWTCESQDKYNFEREGWVSTPIKVDSSGKMILQKYNTHKPGPTKLNDGGIIAGYLLFSFDPRALLTRKQTKYLDYRFRNDHSNVANTARKQCQDIPKSKGYIQIDIGAKLFAGDASDGFGRISNLKNPGWQLSGQSMTDFNNLGRYSQVQPAGWTKTPISHAQATVIIAFNCCSGTCTFGVTGDSMLKQGRENRIDEGGKTIDGAKLQRIFL